MFLVFFHLFAALALASAPLGDLAEVRSIVIRLVDGPARGNTGAAIIAAEQIRRAGFTGKLSLSVPNPSAMRALREMLPGYNAPIKDHIQEVNLESGGTVTVFYNESRKDFGGHIPRPDLELRFGDLDPYAQAGTSTRLLITSGIFSDQDPVTRISFGNALWRRWGETFSYNNMVGFRGLGVYGDLATEDALETLRQEGGRGILLRESAVHLEEEGVRLGRSHRYDPLVRWLEAPGAQTRSFAVTYGFGYDDIGKRYANFHMGERHLIAYLRAVKAMEGGQGRSVLVTQVMPPDVISNLTSQGFSVVNVAAGEENNGEPAPGEVRVILSGGLPRSVYARLLVASDLPPVGEGNGFVSAMHPLGRPYLAASSPLNKAMLSQVARWLSSFDGSVAREFAAYGAGDDVNLAPLLSSAGVAAFQGVSEVLHRPLAVSMVFLAERLLANPIDARLEMRRWRQDIAPGGEFDALIPFCAELLTGPKGNTYSFSRIFEFLAPFIGP